MNPHTFRNSREREDTCHARRVEQSGSRSSSPTSSRFSEIWPLITARVQSNRLRKNPHHRHREPP
jgi:hypothetical protein